VIGASPEANHTTLHFTMQLDTEVTVSAMAGPGHRLSDSLFHAT
jgi:hypothetical protein